MGAFLVGQAALKDEFAGQRWKWLEAYKGFQEGLSPERKAQMGYEPMDVEELKGFLYDPDLEVTEGTCTITTDNRIYKVTNEGMEIHEKKDSEKAGRFIKAEQFNVVFTKLKDLASRVESNIIVKEALPYALKGAIPGMMAVLPLLDIVAGTRKVVPSTWSVMREALKEHAPIIRNVILSTGMAIMVLCALTMSYPRVAIVAGIVAVLASIWNILPESKNKISGQTPFRDLKSKLPIILAFLLLPKLLWADTIRETFVPSSLEIFGALLLGLVIVKAGWHILRAFRGIIIKTITATLMIFLLTMAESFFVGKG